VIDPRNPLLTLALVVCNEYHYQNVIVEAVNAFKREYCGGEHIILHSVDIRKKQKSFKFLQDPGCDVQRFYEGINKFVRDSSFSVIAATIDKAKLKSKYIQPSHPYHLSVEFLIERLLPVLEKNHQSKITIVAESRAEKLNRQLLAHFDKLTKEGGKYLTQDYLRNFELTLEFKPKKDNVIGTQLADLIAYPIS
jgi:hypothetical protein